MFKNLKILCFIQKHLIGILTGLEHACSSGTRIHLRHLLCHLTCSCYDLAFTHQKVGKLNMREVMKPIGSEQASQRV